MSRIRSIKPEFFTSLTIAALQPAARLAFIGLWTHVDDDGRCIDEPRLIKAALFPLDDPIGIVEIDELLDELEANGSIVRYQIEGRRYLQVQGWEHQKIDRKKPSNIPAPPPHEPSTNNRRAVDEDSSPDRDRDRDQGSDQGSSSTSTTYTPESRAPEEEPSDQETTLAVIDHIARTRLANSPTPIANTDRWLTKVRADITAHHGQRIADLIAQHPGAPPDLIAARTIGERAPTLATYRRDPTPPPDLAEPPDPEAA